MIEVGKEHYVVSRDYWWLPIMTKVTVEHNDSDIGVFVVVEDDEGEWLHAGYVDEYDLLSADEIIKLWQHHRMIIDSFERHG